MRYALLIVFFLMTAARGAVTGNLLANPGLEEGVGMPTGWSAFTAWGEGTVSIDDAVAHSGRRAIRVEGVKPVTQVFLRTGEMDVAPGEKFYASAWVRTEHLVGEVGGVLMADFARADGHSDDVARFAVVPKEAAGKWIRVEGVVTVPALAKVMRLRVGMWNAKGVAWFDDVELKALTPVSCRVDLAGPRVTPAMTALPVTLINREGGKGKVEVRVGESKVGVELNGEAVQKVGVPLPTMGRGKQRLVCKLVRDGKVLGSEEREVVVPAAAVLSLPIPTHWVVEDGDAAVEGEVDLAVTSAELKRTIQVELRDGKQQIVGRWESQGELKDGLNPFRVAAGPLAVGEYWLVARVGGKELRRPFFVIHRAEAETTLNAAGYLVQQGKPIFPLGIFNGAGRSAEMGEAGFTIQHAYNACDVVEGQRPDDEAAFEFLNKAQAAGLKCLFLIPRGFLFAGDWDAFRRRVRMFRNHPALLAWDEEEGLARGDMDLKGLARMGQIIRAEDPHHPIMVGDAREEITNIADRATLFPADLMDLGMWWWYPIPPRPAGGSLLNGDDATSGMELTPPAFLTRAVTKKPIWVGVQSYKKEQSWGRYPTAAEYRAQAYIAVIHGAKGLMWYGGYVEGGVFAGPAEESHWEGLKGVVRELRELSDVLMAPAEATPTFVPAEARLSLSLRRAGTRTVLMAANRDRRPVDVTIALPVATGVKVLGESRTIAAGDGGMKDHFEGYAVHVYELEKSP